MSVPRVLTALVLLVAFGTACGESRDPVSSVDTHQFATTTQFWTEYTSDPIFARIVDGRLVYDGDGAWGNHPTTGIDAEIRCDGSIVAHVPVDEWGARIGSTVDFDPFQITAVQRWAGARSGASGDLTIVAAYDAAADESLVSFVWSSADGRQALDAQSRDDVLSVSGARFTGIAIDPDAARVYVADVARFLLLRIDDTDSDDVPDTVAASPAASHPTYCGDTSTGEVPIGIVFLSKTGTSGILPVYHAEPLGLLPTTEAYRGHEFWEDSDGDGVIDTVTTWSPESFERIESEDLYAGALEVRVDGTPGTVRELWLIDTGGSPTTKLAGRTLVARYETLSFSTALTSGDRVAFTTENAAEILWTESVIAAPLPRITSVVPSNAVRNGGPTTLTVEGERFQSGILVKLVSGSQVVATGTITSFSPTSLTVTLPDILNEYPGAYLEFQNPNAPSARTIPFPVRAP